MDAKSEVQPMLCVIPITVKRKQVLFIFQEIDRSVSLPQSPINNARLTTNSNISYTTQPWANSLGGIKIEFN